ncbi:MAG: class I SAM-dependent methyltransferase [Dehalococcoidia bacterium]|nr:MAG: class I SAM-dependent methyltransferase [Dehalococcoidia bacterium]
MSSLTIIKSRLLASQFRQPRGLIGRLVGRAMARGDKEASYLTISQLDIQPDDHILEVGFGPGVGIKALSKMASKGFIAGIDFSKTMVQEASKLNAIEIRDGRVQLKEANVSSIPYDNDSFNKVFAVNVVYFWPDIRGAISEMKRVMKPGGTLALFMASLELLVEMGLAQSPLYINKKPEEVINVLDEAGFHKVWVKPSSNRKVSCILAQK